MIAEAIDKILNLAKYEFFTADDGRIYTSKVFYPVKEPEPAPIQTRTLLSIKEYLNEDVDGLLVGQDAKRLIIHIVSENEVLVISKLLKPFEQRKNYMVAKCDPKLMFQFGKFYDAEHFVIALQSLFVYDEEVAKVLCVSGNIQDGFIRRTSDDGISQTVRTKTGVTTKAEVKVPNPVTLRPYRTFSEVEQPASKFVFRMRSVGDDRPPEMALFEADGGAWKNDAMKNIHDYFAREFPTEPIVILS